MVKWIKYYTTGSDVVKTFNVATQEYESEGQTHQFTSAEDALSKSTTEVLTVWDGVVEGVGEVAE